MQIMENENKEKRHPAEAWILKDGPIMLRGNFTFKDSSGKITQGEQELYICRCGGSSNKPFCDETHKKIGVAY
jgi:CDGSH-type Zn-finger protein